LAVAEAARQHGSRVVFFSTDHVFDGARSSYGEDDPIVPLNAYARSKVDAERAIRELLPDGHVIIRTGWVYGPDRQRRNFVLHLIDRLRSGTSVRVPSDQWGSPTCTVDLAAATAHLLERGATGTFHATGPELTDRASLARRVCERFALDPALVVAQPTSALGQAAQRSLRVLLDCSKLRATGAPPFRNIAAGLELIAAWSTSTAEWQHT
jgi:dTDP-4-dehydrorhamnose reductase